MKIRRTIYLMLLAAFLLAFMCGCTSAEPSKTPEEIQMEEYSSSVDYINSQVVEGIDLIDELFVVHTHDMVSVLQNSHIAFDNTAQGLGALISAEMEAKTLTPPAKYSAAHKIWLDSISEYSRAAKKLKVGLTKGKEKTINKSIDIFERAAKKFNAAADAFASAK